MRFLFGLAIVAAVTVINLASSREAMAYCVTNNTEKALRVKLDSYNPLGKFYRLVQPGKQACCDWFDHTCNPGTSRNGLVYLKIRAKHRDPFYCAHNPLKQVKVVGDGTVTVTEDPTARGGLRCRSIDLFMREVSAPGYRPAGRQIRPIIVPPQPGGLNVDEIDKSLPGDNTKSGVAVPAEP